MTNDSRESKPSPRLRVLAEFGLLTLVLCVLSFWIGRITAYPATESTEDSQVVRDVRKLGFAVIELDLAIQGGANPFFRLGRCRALAHCHRCKRQLLLITIHDLAQRRQQPFDQRQILFGLKNAVSKSPILQLGANA